MTLLLVWLLACGPVSTPAAQPDAIPELAGSGLRAIGKAPLGGALYEPKDLSGGALVGDQLFLVSDEGGSLMRLEPEDGGWRHQDTWLLPELTSSPAVEAGSARPELDLEALTVVPGGLFVLGSHSAIRKQTRPEKTLAKNQERLSTIAAEEHRRFAGRLSLEADGSPSSFSLWDLFPALTQHPVLGSFIGLPSKENGLDLEGVTLLGDDLLLGARGPILRGGWVPVLVMPLDGRGALAETRYLPLGGLGIRDLLTVTRGVVVLSGPMGDGPGAYALHLWDGRDCMVGRDAGGCRLTPLGTLGDRPGKPEGLVLEAETNDMLHLLLIEDGVPESIGRLEVSLP